MSFTPEAEWQQFLERVQVVRSFLKCSASSAWFRGHSDRRWLLQPTILRNYIIGNIADFKNEKDYHQLKCLNDAFALLNIKNGFMLRFSSDQKRSIERILAKVKNAKRGLKICLDQTNELGALLAGIRNSQSGNQISAIFDVAYINKLSAKYQFSVVSSSSPNPAKSMLAKIDRNEIQRIYDLKIAKRKEFGSVIDSAKSSLLSTIAVAYGEREAYTEFNYKLRRDFGSSWSVLSRMQHYGIPTRLLDWSESLYVGLWFSLKNHIQEYTDLRRNTPDLSTKEFVQAIVYKMRHAPFPSIWILNPYFLSQSASGENRIFDFTISDDVDYYRSFFDTGWSIKGPLPIYAPWRDDERMSSQHAMFTVHGLDLNPIDKQVSNDVIHEVIISPEAAAFGAYQLANIYPIDKFSMFRDLDSLGQTVRDTHVIRKECDKSQLSLFK